MIIGISEAFDLEKKREGNINSFSIAYRAKSAKSYFFSYFQIFC